MFESLVKNLTLPDTNQKNKGTNGAYKWVPLLSSSKGVIFIILLLIIIIIYRFFKIVLKTINRINNTTIMIPTLSLMLCLTTSLSSSCFLYFLCLSFSASTIASFLHTNIFQPNYLPPHGRPQPLLLLLLLPGQAAVLLVIPACTRN